MPKRRIPLKGRPFSGLSDEKLKSYLDMFQDFIHCFKYEDKHKEQVVQEIWKMLADEDVDRWNDREPILEKPVSYQEKSEITTAPRIKKRPLIKKKGVDK